MPQARTPLEMFTVEDIREASSKVNFDYAQGPDGFYGNILHINAELELKIF